jgi:hypothetical protein
MKMAGTGATFPSTPGAQIVLETLLLTVQVLRAMNRPDDGGSKHLWNVGKFLSEYTAQQLRRQPSSTHNKFMSLSLRVSFAISMDDLR